MGGDCEDPKVVIPQMTNLIDDLLNKWEESVKKKTVPPVEFKKATQVSNEMHSGTTSKSTGFSQMKVQKSSEVFLCKFECGTLVRWPENYDSGPPVNASDGKPHDCPNRDA